MVVGVAYNWDDKDQSLVVARIEEVKKILERLK
jgi:hypothetical protein